MNIGSAITIIGTAVILFYGIIKILEFYGIGIDKYGSYLAFYFFLIVTAFIVPTQYKYG